MLSPQKNKLLDILLNVEYDIHPKDDGCFVARCFAFFQQFICNSIVKEQYFSRVPCKLLYSRHKSKFDNLARIFTKNKIDILSYVKFFVLVEQMNESRIDNDLLSMQYIVKYSDYLLSIERKKKICKYVVKSAKFIADECIKMKFKSSKDYLKYLIKQNKLGAYYISGKISKYFLSAIPSFEKIVDRLDYFSRIDFSDIKKLHDVYNSDAQDAFMQNKNMKFNPLSFADQLIEKKIKKSQEDLFDDSL